MIWITVDVALAKHPKMAALPNDTARYGWLVTLCEAKMQHPPGKFASARHYREVMGRFARYLPSYLSVNLLEQNSDGTLSIHDWRKHQYNKKSRGHDVDTALTESGPTDTDTDTKTVTNGSFRPPLSPLGTDTKPTHISEILPRVVRP